MDVDVSKDALHIAAYLWVALDTLLLMVVMGLLRLVGVGDGVSFLEAFLWMFGVTVVMSIWRAYRS